MVEVWRRACEIPRAKKDGWRRSRWAVIRNTYPELQMTTVPLWQEWYPEEDYGRFYNSIPFRHVLVDDENLVRAEVWFVSMDKPRDAAKVLSMNLTGAYINEAREIDKANIDAITSRVGRYPSPKTLLGNEEPWGGVIADTNAPDEAHWWPIMEGTVEPPETMPMEDRATLIRPEGWGFFIQPPAMILRRDGTLVMNPRAENLENLKVSYYRDLIAGKRMAWIRVMVLNELGSAGEAATMQEGFSRDFHVARGRIRVDPNLHIMVGVDGGLTPAAVFCQFYRHHNRIAVLRELVTVGRGMAMRQFAARLKQFAAREFPGVRLGVVWCDPSTAERDKANGHLPSRMLRAEGLNALPAPGNNNLEIRVTTVDMLLQRQIDGEPMIVFDPSCVTLIQGLDGQYKRERIHIGTETLFAEAALKNRWSHVCEALQYVTVGLMGTGFSTSSEIRTEPRVPTLSTRYGRRVERSIRKRVRRGKRGDARLSLL